MMPAARPASPSLSSACPDVRIFAAPVGLARPCL